MENNHSKNASAHPACDIFNHFSEMQNNALMHCEGLKGKKAGRRHIESNH